MMPTFWSLKPGMRKSAVERSSTMRAVLVCPCRSPPFTTIWCSRRSWAARVLFWLSSALILSWTRIRLNWLAYYCQLMVSFIFYTFNSWFSSEQALTLSSMLSTYSRFRFLESWADNLFRIFLLIFLRFLSSSLVRG